MIGNKFLSVAGASEPIDAQFNYVTMLLHGDGTNGAQNSTFTDSSSNGFAITRNGTTAQGSLSPYRANGSAYMADRSYVTMPASSDFDLISTDFTIEFWMYPVAFNTMIYSGSNIGGNGFATALNGWGIGFDGSGSTITSFNYFAWASGSRVDNAFSSLSIPFHQWSHIAFVRNGSGSGNLKLYVNGVQQGSALNAATYSTAGSTLVLGPASYLQNTTYSGNAIYSLSNFRLTKSAVYTANFSVSTSPLTAISGTTVLLFQNGIPINNGTNTGLVTSTTLNTDAPFFNTSGPFGQTTAYTPSANGGSVYFISGYPYLSTPTDAAFNFGTGDFTVEFWTYITAGVSNGARLISNAAYNASGIDISYDVSAGGINWYISGTSYRTATMPARNSWNHIAFSRSGTTLRVYLNGVLSNTYTGVSSNITSSNTLAIGGYNGGASYTYDNGYLADVRLIKGTALYTGSTLTLPTAPLTAVSGTSLLLNTNSAAIYDNAMISDFDTSGNTQISTSVKKYGTGSMYFDGSGDYLLSCCNASTSPFEVFGTGDFTVEGWFYFSSAPSSQNVLLSNYQSSSSGWTLSAESNVIKFRALGDPVIVSGATSISATTWHHIAVCRSGTSIKVFLNGVQDGSATNSSDIVVNSTQLNIGRLPNGSGYLTGYIDDLRITKGYARYTTTFTPPTAALPDKGPI